MPLAGCLVVDDQEIDLDINVLIISVVFYEEGLSGESKVVCIGDVDNKLSIDLQ